MDGENGRFAETEPRLFGKQDVLDDHPALGRSVGAVVDRAERSLRAGTGVHRVEVVDERLHRLEGRPVRLAVGVVLGELLRLAEVVVGDVLERLALRLVILLAACKAGIHALFALDVLDDLLDVVDGERTVVDQLQSLRKVGRIQLFVSLDDARSETVIEVGDALPAVLVVLVGLDRDARQSRIALDVVGLAQEAVTGREAALEQLEQIDLAARRRQRVEVEVVDVDVALAVRLALFGREDVFGIVVLRALAAVFEHRAHRGVAVDVGVVALHVAVAGVGERQLVVDAHERGVHLARLGALGTVKYVLFGNVGIAVFHQDLFDHVLDVFDGRAVAGALELVFKTLFDQAREPCALLIVLASGGRHCLADSGLDLGDVVRHPSAVALDDGIEHTFLLVS